MEKHQTDKDGCCCCPIFCYSGDDSNHEYDYVTDPAVIFQHWQHVKYRNLAVQALGGQHLRLPTPPPVNPRSPRQRSNSASGSSASGAPPRQRLRQGSDEQQETDRMSMTSSQYHGDGGDDQLWHPADFQGSTSSPSSSSSSLSSASTDARTFRGRALSPLLDEDLSSTPPSLALFADSTSEEKREAALADAELEEEERLELELDDEQDKEVDEGPPSTFLSQVPEPATFRPSSAPSATSAEPSSLPPTAPSLLSSLRERAPRLPFFTLYRRLALRHEVLRLRGGAGSDGGDSGSGGGGSGGGSGAGGSGDGSDIDGNQMGQAQGQIPPQGEEEEEDPDAEPDWEPEDEELDAEETFTLRYLDQHRRNGCTEQAWRHQRAIFNETHPNGPQLLSLARAISLARTTLDQFSLKFDMCKFGHMSYGCEEYEDLEQCPFCDTPRYLPDPNDGAPPGAPLIPWTEKTPIRQWEYCSIIPTLQADFATAEGSEQACYRGRHHLDRANAKAAAAARGQPFPPPDYVYRNVTDGSGYEAACEDGRFDDKRTALLSFSWDGCLLLPGKDCWYVIILDFSLPPDVRYDLDHIIVLATIPGKPTNFESFLEPFHVDRVRLEDGVWTFDAHPDRRGWFRFKAFFSFVQADYPARAKAGCFVGATGYRACHVCTIGGVRCIGGGATTYHFPHNVPTEWPNPNGAPFVGRPSPLPYHPSSDTFPELRTNERHQQDLDDLNTGPGSFDSRRRRTGLNGISIWHGAALFSMPEFFVLDIMHLLWLNVVPQFFELILGRVKGFERERWVLSEEAIDQVSEELLAAGTDLPSLFGRTPRGLDKVGTFKSKEWSTLTFHYSLEVLRPHLPADVFILWETFVKAASLICKGEITEAEVVEIEDGFASFVEQWEGVFNAKGGALNGEVGGDRERGQFSFITTHLLLHLGAQVRIWGPPLAYSQYPIERVIGQEKNSIHHSSDIEAHVVANAARRQRTSIMLKRFPHLSISHRQQPLTNSLSHTTETSLFTLLHKRRKGLAQEGLRTAIIDCIGNGDDQDDEDDEDDDEDGLELEFFARLKSPEGEVSRSVWGETTAGRRSSAKVRKARRVWLARSDGSRLLVEVYSYACVELGGQQHFLVLAWPFKQEVGDIGTNRYLPLDPADDLEVYSVNEVDGLAVLFRAQREGQERVWATSKIRRLLKHETLN